MHGAAIEFFSPRYLGDRLHAARDQILRPPEFPLSSVAESQWLGLTLQ
jgi:hypothetical protein